MFTKIFRIGNEPTIRYTPSGKAVLNLSLAYSYGQKVDGKKPTQWIDGTLWDKQAEGLAPFLKKGDQIGISLDDVHIEEYDGKNGRSSKLVGRVVGIDFVSGGNKAEPSQSAPAPKPKTAGGFADMDDDSIPF